MAFFTKLMDNFTGMNKDSPIKKKEGFEGEITFFYPTGTHSDFTKNALIKNLYLTDIGYYPKALHHNRQRKRGSEQYILIYCLQGEGWFRVQEKTFSVKANHFFILPPGSEHSYGSDVKNPWTIYWVHFNGELAEDYFNYLIEKNSLKPRIAIPSKERNLLFDEIIHYASMIKNRDATIYANNCLYNYLASFKNILVAQSKSELRNTSIVESCIELMKANLDKNLNLYELSKMMDISISHLSTLFKEKLNESPYNHYIFLKIQRACFLLWHSGDHIKTVAQQLGYDDPYHFSRVFKHRMGISPKEFRNRDK